VRIEHAFHPAARMAYERGARPREFRPLFSWDDLFLGSAERAVL
jgi:hypothetical protein